MSIGPIVRDSGVEFAKPVADRHLRLTGLLLPFAIYAVVVMAGLPLSRYMIGTDGISYVFIARHYLEGRWAEALNPYWSPLYSWLMVPVLGVGVSGMLAARLVSVLAGAWALWCLRMLSITVGLTTSMQLPTLCTAAVMLGCWSLIWITPDMLSTAVILSYLTFVLGRSWWNTGFRSMGAGALGALGYYAKAYNFYYFLGSFTVIALIAAVSSRDTERKKVVRGWLIAIAAFAFGCAPWIGVVSHRAGNLSISTASEWNRRLVGPDSPGNPQFYRLMPPSSEHALSMWENPSPDLLPKWSPFSSRRNFRHQVVLLARNTRDLVEMFLRASILSASALLMYFLLTLSKRDTTALSVIAAVAIMPVGYVAVTLRDRYSLDDRYVWVAILFVMFMGFVVIQYGKPVLSNFAKVFAILSYGLTFTASPLIGLAHTRDAGRNLAIAGDALMKVIPAGSRVASCGDWNDGINTAYLINTPFYGSTGITADQEGFREQLNPDSSPRSVPKPLTQEQVQASLRDNKIEFLFVWPDCRENPVTAAPYKTVRLMNGNVLNVYRLR